jgi:hypothetical protein
LIAPELHLVRQHRQTRLLLGHGAERVPGEDQHGNLPLGPACRPQHDVGIRIRLEHAAQRLLPENHTIRESNSVTFTKR